MNKNVKYSEQGRCGPSWSEIEKAFDNYDGEPTLVTFVEAEYDFNIAKSSHEIEGNWVGIVHDPLDTHKYYKNHGKRRNHLKGRGFRKSLERCKGLFFLTKTDSVTNGGLRWMAWDTTSNAITDSTQFRTMNIDFHGMPSWRTTINE